MAARGVDPARDPIQPGATIPVTIHFEGRELTGIAGQSIAGVLLANGISSWRTASRTGEPRGAFCGIGICFDCVAEVNRRRDVRTCQRRAGEGDIVIRQADPLPGMSPAAAEDPRGGVPEDGAQP